MEPLFVCLACDNSLNSFLDLKFGKHIHSMGKLGVKFEDEQNRSNGRPEGG